MRTGRWIALALLAASGCGGDMPSGSQVDVFTMTEWMKIQTLSPLGALPADTTNRYGDNAMAAALGQRLYFDKSFSGALQVAGSLGMVGDTGKVNCGTCHSAADGWFDDAGHNVTLGIKFTSRNDPSLVNVAFYDYFGWAGRTDTLWTFSIGALEGTQASSRLAIAHILYRKYKSDYNAVFVDAPLPSALDPAAADAARFPPSGKPKKSAMDPDGPWEMMAAADQKIVNTILADTGKALAAYQRQLVSRNSPFDQYAAGSYSAITAPAKRGLGLFIGKAACVACHSGAFFTDQKFHNTAVPEMGANVPMTDDGHFGDLGQLIANKFNGASAYSDDMAKGTANLAELGAPSDANKGQFRTKNLRQIAKTAPYMHDGVFATLADVVNFYNVGGGAAGTFVGTKDPKMVPLNLTPDEVNDVVAFLGTLTGDAVPAALTMDTSAP